MSEKERILKILREDKAELQARFGVRDLGLFGSVAREGAGPESDVDLLVEFRERVDLFQFMELAEYLENRLGRKVDLVPKRKVRPELREAIFRETTLV